MGRRKNEKADILEILPPLGGLIVAGVLFVPGFKQLLGSLFFLAIGVLGLVVVGLIIRAIWRHYHSEPEVLFPPPPRKPAGGLAPLVIPRREASQPEKPDPIKDGWSLGLLKELEWHRFEEVVAAYLRELGYEAKTTRTGADGGVDVQLFQNGQPHPVMIVQCKAWDVYKVGVKPVRELYGVMAADKVANGAFFTTGEFTSEAHDWARDKSLDLVDGREFMSRLSQLSPAIQQKLLETATEGDYTTPSCPACGIKMVQRTAGKGSNVGTTFWGCRNYPNCRQTFKMPQTS